MVIAKKLNVAQFAEWIESELYGYKSNSGLPGYRILPASVEALNPYHGWQPVLFQDAKEAATFSESHVLQSISQVEDLSRANGSIHHPFEPESTAYLMRGMNVSLPPTRRIAAASMKGVVDAVRTEILQWCLKLENDGIMGEGLTFSQQERSMAEQNRYTTHFHIEHMTQSQIQNATSASTQILEASTFTLDSATSVLQQLRTHLDEIGLNTDDRKRIEADSSSVEMQLTSPQPNRGVIREAFRSIREVLEGTTGSLVASGLLYEIGRLLSG